ncbi:WD40 repeat-like protein, partial [Pholiota molesta]
MRLPDTLPSELVSRILEFLPLLAVVRASRVSKSWRNIIDTDPVLWRDLLKDTKSAAFTNSLYALRQQEQSGQSIIPTSLSLPHPYKMLFKSRYITHTRWVKNPEPKHISFPVHGSSLLHSLQGHEGDTLVSGSTDQTVRIWDLSTGRCTHVFDGHRSTVRCISIVKPEIIDVERNGVNTKEKKPNSSLRVWALPRPKEKDTGYESEENHGVDPAKVDVDQNPYHNLHLAGHSQAVRALAARGRTAVSGSYDCDVRVWDIISGRCKHVLRGHTHKVYSVVLDLSRHQSCSGSMDGNVRVWNIQNGECLRTLTGHTSVVGQLGLSPSYLVSAAADSTLRVWDAEGGQLQHTLTAHTGAITCFQHDEFKLLSGSDGDLKLWDVRDGTFVKNLLTGVTSVWQVVFQGWWCVAASNRSNVTFLDVWNFRNENDDERLEESPDAFSDEDIL